MAMTPTTSASYRGREIERREAARKTERFRVEKIKIPDPEKRGGEAREIKSLLV